MVTTNDKLVVYNRVDKVFRGRQPEYTTKGSATEAGIFPSVPSAGAFYGGRGNSLR